MFIPISGWMVNRFGAKTVFRAAIAVFIVGSVACAVSNSLPAFVLSRFLQGIGGAMMTPVGRLVLVRATPKSELVAAMSAAASLSFMRPAPDAGNAVSGYGGLTTPRTLEVSGPQGG
ncbi:Multidrug efflux protein (fragment) [Mesorhizobium delmotii]|uniref:Multidrug efflux protein n=1 Tax=Mesorhizobium delmotii TaxID=1631247 RepID=A0A2P9AFY4_9HYPH